ncbi:MAG: amino acid permease, partial [Gemmatimonadetes bacterium]|nr:amino acid permease [Gemmatimonadota bacterium]
YVYLREAYGPFCGFLFGWVSFTMYLTGIIAALAVGFAEYAGYFIPSFGMANVFFETEIALPGWTFQYSLSAGHVTALVLVVLLTVVNYRGVTFSKHITNVSSVIKIAALGLFILFGLWSGSAQPIDFRINPQEIDFGQLVVAFGVALIAVAWAFAGWEEVTFVAGEVRDPARNLPRALVVGAASVTVVYLLVNYIYLKAMPAGEMAGIVRVGEVAANVLFGETGAVLVSAAVIVSIVGALNASILVGPRVYFAMARDGLFFKRAGTVHPRYRTPGQAVIFQAAWACVLTLSGTFEDLITFVTFANLMLWIAGAAAVFTLRRKQPDLPRPYKAWGYPAVPLLFIAGSAGILANMLFETPVESVSGLALTALGIPAYLFLRRRSNAASKTGKPRP